MSGLFTALGRCIPDYLCQLNYPSLPDSALSAIGKVAGEADLNQQSTLLEFHRRYWSDRYCGVLNDVTELRTLRPGRARFLTNENWRTNPHARQKIMQIYWRLIHHEVQKVTEVVVLGKTRTQVENDLEQQILPYFAQAHQPIQASRNFVAKISAGMMALRFNLFMGDCSEGLSHRLAACTRVAETNTLLEMKKIANQIFDEASSEIGYQNFADGINIFFMVSAAAAATMRVVLPLISNYPGTTYERFVHQMGLGGAAVCVGWGASHLINMSCSSIKGWWNWARGNTNSANREKFWDHLAASFETILAN